MTGKTISPSTCIQRSEAVLFSELPSDTVMMDIDRGMYYGVNSVGARIWRMIEMPASLRDVCDQLVDVYGIETERCEREVLPFIEKLVDFGVVEIVADPDNR